MERLAVCRICLCLNGNVRSLAEDTQLQELYERLTTILFQTSDMRPLALCYICHAQLNAARRLMLNCLKAEKQLTEMVNMLARPEKDRKPMLIDRSALRQLTISSVELLIIDSPDDDEYDEMRVKDEIIAYEEAQLMREFEEQSMQAVPTAISSCSETYNKDDIPLNNLRKSTETSSEQEEVREVENEPSGSEEAAPIANKPELDPELNRSTNDKYVNTIQLEANRHRCYYNKKKLNVKDSNQTNIKIINSKIISNDNVSVNSINSINKCIKTSYNNDASNSLVEESNLETCVLNSEKQYICDVCKKCFSEKSTLARHCRTHTSCAYEREQLKREFEEQTESMQAVPAAFGLYSDPENEQSLSEPGDDIPLNNLKKSTETLRVQEEVREGENEPSGSEEAAPIATKPDLDPELNKSTIDKYVNTIKLGTSKLNKDSYQTNIKRNSKIISNNNVSVNSINATNECIKTNYNNDAVSSSVEESNLETCVLNSVKQYICDVCKKCFSKKSTLTKHCRTHATEKPHVCNVCNNSYDQSSQLNRHLRIHTRGKEHISDKCKKSFSQKYHIKSHLRTHTGEKPYVCDVCNKSFSQKISLQIHLRTHTGEKPYVCDVCNKSFSQNINLKKHLRTHTGEKPYVCDVCNKSFSQDNILKNHLRTHTGEKPYVCDVCNKSFSRNIILKNHLRTHTGEKPYECDVCKKCFREKGFLKNHLRTHTGEKPYVCDVCSKSFSLNINFKKHLRTHTGEKPYVCDVCNKSFSQNISLKKHLRTHTGEKPYVCDVCNKSFSQNINLKNHLRTHTGEKPYVCDVCNKSFSRNIILKNHLRTHTGEKPYVCDVSSKSFRNSSNLKVHSHIHTVEKPFKSNQEKN